MKKLLDIHVCLRKTARLICFGAVPLLATLAATSALPASLSRGQDPLPRVTLAESAHATIAEPGRTGRLNNAINSVSYSSDGSMIAAGMRDPNLVLILDPATRSSCPRARSELHARWEIPDLRRAGWHAPDLGSRGEATATPHRQLSGERDGRRFEPRRQSDLFRRGGARQGHSASLGCERRSVTPFHQGL